MPDFGTIGTFLASLGAAFAAIFGGVVAWRKAKHEEGRDDRTHLDSLFTKQASRIDALEVAESERTRRERALIDYIFRLQLHIVDRKPPPPPPWPKLLLPDDKEE